jgi:membrane protein YqaA with SNARE-associated domain
MIWLFIVIPGWKLLRSLGGVGLVILGVVDSSVIPTFGSLDALTAILAVKNHELWPYYAAASTAGSLIGAYLTYRMSVRAGEHWLEKSIGPKRSRQVQGLLKRWGFAAVFVSCVAPPPFPTSPFFIGAGALRYPQGRFISAVVAGRALRYTAIGFLAAKYSHSILRFLRHPRGFEADAKLIGITVGGFAVLVLLILSWRLSKTYFQRIKAESGGD